VALPDVALRYVTDLTLGPSRPRTTQRQVGRTLDRWPIEAKGAHHETDRRHRSRRQRHRRHRRADGYCRKRPASPLISSPRSPTSREARRFGVRATRSCTSRRRGHPPHPLTGAPFTPVQGVTPEGWDGDVVTIRPVDGKTWLPDGPSGVLNSVAGSLLGHPARPLEQPWLALRELLTLQAALSGS
jgi:hypothetical protein